MKFFRVIGNVHTVGSQSWKAKHWCNMLGLCVLFWRSVNGLMVVFCLCEKHAHAFCLWIIIHSFYEPVVMSLQCCTGKYSFWPLLGWYILWNLHVSFQAYAVIQRNVSSHWCKVLVIKKFKCTARLQGRLKAVYCVIARPVTAAYRVITHIGNVCI